ncbi:hypothetical protein Nocox_36875 [Nonomuraea coxensis DSM 45129]|uniref:Uncharacterized protein n=1 Tax=Nonomuraea coxensis DSM 45129 TaxID=1122611 RepID=A0ABX8UB00_9ACTN|nr:hypothetical protein [Nonomuraea coxensis]QYC44929.1 hypothetical protein Nocox_36875 [Nonomuraea coxensis DSM 45129]
MTSKTTQDHCLIGWCVSNHDDGDPMHFGGGADFLVLATPLLTRGPSPEMLSVGIEQVEHDGKVQTMISLDVRESSVYLTRDQAKLVALHLLKLDIDASAVDRG